MNGGWYFHNAVVAIDTDCALPSKAEGSTQTQFATTTFYRLINPVSGWRAFNPNDNQRLTEAASTGAKDPIPVGFMQMLYHVIDLKKLEPIYWSRVVQPAHVHYGRWVFASTQTPVAPDWDTEICALYDKLKPWTAEYLETVESARVTPEILNLIAVKATFLQGSQPLDITILFEPGSDGVAHLFSTNRFNVSKRLANDLILHKAPKDVCQTLVPFDWMRYQKLHGYTEQLFQIIGFKPPEVTSLILVFHGIGQKLSEKIDSVNFTYAIESLRVLIHSLLPKKPVSEHVSSDTHILVLPVNWRTALSFQDDGDSFPLEDISPPTIPLVRRAITDIFMDLPYYMSHHRSRILEAAAAEANRLYELLCKYNPSFQTKGRVNLIGHSLGSLIVADLLSAQPNDCKSEGARLNFDTKCFFTTGSPLALFLHFQHANIIPRGLIGDNKPRLGCFAVESFYNLINHSDVFAFLLSPTVKGNPIKRPRVLDHTALRGERRSFSIFNRTRASIKTVETTPELKMLNDYGQLDWILPVGPRTFENQYFKIFTAHFDYWCNVEFATFVAIECCRKTGPGNAVEEYKVQASQL